MTYSYSLMKDFESPFYKKALASGYQVEKSGKPDDISLVIGRIIKEEI